MLQEHYKTLKASNLIKLSIYLRLELVHLSLQCLLNTVLTLEVIMIMKEKVSKTSVARMTWKIKLW